MDEKVALPGKLAALLQWRFDVVLGAIAPCYRSRRATQADAHRIKHLIPGLAV